MAREARRKSELDTAEVTGAEERSPSSPPIPSSPFPFLRPALEAGGELGEDVAVGLPLERDDEVGEARRLGPAPGVELGMRGGEVDVFVGAGEAQQEPLLALPLPTSLPQLAGERRGDVVFQPEAALGDDLRLRGADLLRELAERR